MVDRTSSDLFVRPPPARRRAREALTLIGLPDHPISPVRYWLDDIDEIVVDRGPVSARRFNRALALHVPDRYMSAAHARIVRGDGWLIESPSSKNGVVVAGHATRCATLAPGDIVEIGHCVFALEHVERAGDTGDIVLTSDRPHPLLASFHPDLIVAEATLGKIAPSHVPVLIHGETGVGKEVYARAVHDGSKRVGPFVAVNCGALSASLLEAELFGHRRGAFSGAISDRPGFVRSADGGTLFLDEITELTPSAQVALLRVLQEDEVIPVGDTRPVAVDLRVCAASQRPLRDEVDCGRFRSDLYARLIGHEIALPPLRERRTDLGYLIASLATRIPNGPIRVTPPALRAMLAYPWPRNIRELERCLATAAVLADGDPIDVAHIPAYVRGDRDEPTRTIAEPVDDPTGELRVALAHKLTEHRGNITAVARDLHKHREQVQRWIRRFGFDVALFRRR